MDLAIYVPPRALIPRCALQFFFYDTPKVLLLFTGSVFVMRMINSYFRPECTRALLVARHCWARLSAKRGSTPWRLRFKDTALLFILFSLDLSARIAFLEDFDRRFPLRFAAVAGARSEPPNECDDTENDQRPDNNHENRA